MTRNGPKRSPHHGAIGFRQETAADEALVRRAHVDHRRELFAALPWPPDALDRLCAQQHELQEHHIATHHADADRLVIEVGGHAVGRLCLDRTARTWRIVDIAIVPEAQGRGSGAAAVRRVLTDAAAAGVAVELQVALDNPRAEALYRRLGFSDAIGTAATHRRLVWTPSASSS